uniref:SDR family oxidoreductase n=1 Tax=Pseudonocardia pini TaxID=2758030 RepID=UPI0015F0CD6C
CAGEHRDADVDALAAHAREVLPGVDLLVNSPGVVVNRLLADAEPADWDLVMGVNFDGVVRCCRAFLPQLRATGGHIVNNASIAALVVQDVPGLGLYTASKYALLAYSRTLANEEGHHGVRVSLVTAGRVATALAANSERYAGARWVPRGPQPASGEAMSAEQAGELIVRGLTPYRFLIFTHPERRDQVAAAHRELLAEIDGQVAL